MFNILLYNGVWNVNTVHVSLLYYIAYIVINLLIIFIHMHIINI